jgi:hypothetical protein
MNALAQICTSLTLTAKTYYIKVAGFAKDAHCIQVSHICTDENGKTEI